jgi:hypothetical protein
MAMNDPIPLFLSEQHDQLDIGKDRAVISSRIVKTSILVVTAAAIVFAILAVANPRVLFENAMASLFATSTPQDNPAQSMPSVQSTADAQALPPTASEAPTGGEIAVASKTADQGQTEIRQPPADVMLNQFQAWAAEKDARPQVPRVQPVQEAQAPAVENARPPVRQVQKQRRVRPVQNARAKGVRNARAQMQRAQDARAQARPEQNAQPQDRSVQNAPAPARPVQDAAPSWLPQSLGGRN